MAKKVTAVVPCYNEAERIGKVLDALTKSREIGKTVVVNDGNEDNSAEVIRRYDVVIIQNDRKLGKSEAIRQALEHVATDVVLLCDADLVGLTPEHVSMLVSPVINNGNVMTMAVLDKYWHFDSDSIKKRLTLLPINGTRALRTSVLREACSHRLFSKYGAEPVINMVCRKRGVRLSRVSLEGVKDVMKPFKKRHGWLPHLEETINVTDVYSRIYFNEAIGYAQAIPRMLRNKISYGYAAQKEKLQKLLKNF